MLKEYASVSIGVLTLLAAGAAVYGISILNTEIQAKPEPVKIPDYSDELDSLKSQVGSIKNDLALLNTLRTDITNINEKLVDLEKKNNQAEKIVSLSAKLTIVLDKSTYFSGDTIKITVIGANPQKVVQIQFLDNEGFILIHKETWSDSTGKVLYNLELSSALTPGNYELRLISNEQTESQKIKIETPSNNPTNPLSADSYTFTVKTNKSIYHTGELIEVSGTGKPNTAVTGVLTSPTGKTYTSTTTTDSNGSYIMFHVTSQPYETGKWYITMSNVAKTIVVSISIE